MVDLRMPGEADPADDANAFRLGGDAGELDAVGSLVKLDAVEPGIKVKMPPRTAQLAVSRKLQADFLLLPYQAFDFAVFDRFEFLSRDRTGGAFCARLLGGRGTQQAADMIGTEGGRCAEQGHPQTSFATSTTMRSFAHCSLSASTLPSSVEANPHCGDSASCSKATYFVASSMRRLISALF